MNYIIGLGSGRCGTMSLSKLIGCQHNAQSFHERHPALHWDNEADPCRHLKWANYAKEIFADVGFYYLPHVVRIMKNFPQTRFICLKRPMESTVASFLNYIPKNHYPWKTKPMPGYTDSVWDRSYPKIEAPSREEAIKKYWTLYYERARSLEMAHENFRVFPMSALNSELGVKDILLFAGIKNPVVKVGIRAHVKHYKKD